jgi:hypothetical protein
MGGIIDDDVQPIRRQLGANGGKLRPVALVADPERDIGEGRIVDAPIGGIDPEILPLAK